MPLTTSSPLVRILKHDRPPPTKFKGSFSRPIEVFGGSLVAAMAGTARFCDCHEHNYSPRESSTGTRRSANCVGARARVTPPHLRIGRANLSFFFFHGFRGAASEPRKLPPPPPPPIKVRTTLVYTVYSLTDYGL